jgi:hypothetical protein
LKVDHGSTGPNAGAVSNYTYDKASNRSNVTVTGGSGGGGGTTCSGVSFAVTDASANEGTSLSFTVSKTGTTTDSCTVSYQTADGTAIAGTNYTAKPLTPLSFASNVSSQTVSVATTDDGVVTGDLTMSLNLSAPSGSSTITGAQGIGTVHNIDSTGGSTCTGVSFSVADSSTNEGTNIVFRITKSGSTADTCSLIYATADGTAKAGTDYSSQTNSVTFLPSDVLKSVSLPTIDNGAVTPALTMYVNLSAPSGTATISDSQALGTITDVDGGGGTTCSKISFSIADATAVNEGSNLSFKISKSGSVANDCSVSYGSQDGTAHAGRLFSLAAWLASGDSLGELRHRA